ncbi:MAG: hypothetical protein R3C56_25545 [Pirellulaceae bacterium]
MCDQRLYGGPDGRDRLVTRRSFVVTGSVLASSALTATQGGAVLRGMKRPSRLGAIPIIDTHIHLFDAKRPQGAPYAGPGGDSPHVSLPPRYRRLAEPLGIVGAIKVEASPWIEDNL